MTLLIHLIRIVILLLIRVAPDLIFFKSDRGRIWPDLGLQIRPGPGLEPNVLELEA